MAYLIVAFSFALSGGIVGKLKGSSFWIWFLISGFLPFVGLMAALLYRTERDELRRQCPDVRESGQAARPVVHPLRRRAVLP